MGDESSLACHQMCPMVRPYSRARASFAADFCPSSIAPGHGKRFARRSSRCVAPMRRHVYIIVDHVLFFGSYSIHTVVVNNLLSGNDIRILYHIRMELHRLPIIFRNLLQQFYSTFTVIQQHFSLAFVYENKIIILFSRLLLFCFWSFLFWFDFNKLYSFSKRNRGLERHLVCVRRLLCVRGFCGLRHRLQRSECRFGWRRPSMVELGLKIE